MASSEISSAVHPSRTTFCVVCKESIRLGAKKCVHCDSFQTWRRHIAVGDSFLALLVALVSVLSLSVPLLRTALRPNNSVLKVAFQDVEGPYLFAIASNLGGKPGTVGHAELEVAGLQASFGAFIVEAGVGSKSARSGGKFWGVLPLTAKGWDEEKTFIPAGEVRPLRLTIAEEAHIDLSDDAIKRSPTTPNAPAYIYLMPDFDVRLVVEVIQFDGKREIQTYAPEKSSMEALRLRKYVLRFAQGRKASQNAEAKRPGAMKR